MAHCCAQLAIRIVATPKGQSCPKFSDDEDLDRQWCGVRLGNIAHGNMVVIANVKKVMEMLSRWIPQTHLVKTIYTHLPSTVKPEAEDCWMCSSTVYWCYRYEGHSERLC